MQVCAFFLQVRYAGMTHDAHMSWTVSIVHAGCCNAWALESLQIVCVYIHVAWHDADTFKKNSGRFAIFHLGVLVRLHCMCVAFSLINHRLLAACA